MCRWLKDILYPLNVLGGRPVNICTYDTTNTPETVVQFPNKKAKVFTIVYTGQQIDVVWTDKRSSIYGTQYEKQQQTYTGGGTETLQIHVGAWGGAGSPSLSINGESVVFRCKGVTSLTVNGDVLI